MTNLDYKADKSAWHKYGVSKAGNVFYGKEFAKRYKAEDIFSVVGASLAHIHKHVTATYQ